MIQVFPALDVRRVEVSGSKESQSGPGLAWVVNIAF